MMMKQATGESVGCDALAAHAFIEAYAMLIVAPEAGVKFRSRASAA